MTRTLCLLVVAVVLQASELFAEESDSDSQSSDTGRFFALPVEIEADSGATNGDAPNWSVRLSSTAAIPLGK